MSPTPGRPTLVVVSGGPGTGKTTLAHDLASALGCPAVIRDEIKQGMVLSTPGHRSGGSDPLDRLTFAAFAEVLAVLLTAGVSVVAEAAFQDRLWRSLLQKPGSLGRLRVIRCAAPAEVAHERIVRRAARSPHRAAHADRELLDAIASGARSLDDFEPISLDAPTLDVDTSDGYAPGLAAMVAFARETR